MIKLKENDFKDYKSARIEIGMYLSFCLSEEEKQRLKDKWNENGDMNSFRGMNGYYKM